MDLLTYFGPMCVCVYICVNPLILIRNYVIATFIILNSFSYDFWMYIGEYF